VVGVKPAGVVRHGAVLARVQLTPLWCNAEGTEVCVCVHVHVWVREQRQGGMGGALQRAQKCVIVCVRVHVRVWVRVQSQGDTIVDVFVKLVVWGKVGHAHVCTCMYPYTCARLCAWLVLMCELKKRTRVHVLHACVYAAKCEERGETCAHFLFTCSQVREVDQDEMPDTRYVTLQRLERRRVGKECFSPGMHTFTVVAPNHELHIPVHPHLHREVPQS